MRKILTILLLLLNVYSFSQTISGYVTDSLRNIMPNANISLNRHEKGTITDSNGYFKLSLEKPGKYILKASFIGYEPAIKQIELNDNQNITIDFVLIPSTIFTPEVEIQAKKTDGFDHFDVPIRVKTLNTYDLVQIPAISSSKLFNNISGIDVRNEFGIFSSQTVVSLRGLGGGQSGTLVVIDGTPLNKSESGSVNWNMIDIDGIEKIEIMKGPGSVLFGSNAMGGVILITTSKPKSLFSADMSLGYGRYNTMETKLNTSGRSLNNLIYWKANIMFRRSDGYVYTPDYEIIENDTIIVPVYLREYSAGAMLGFQINEQNRLELSFDYYDDRRGSGIKIFEDLGANDEHDTYSTYLRYKGNYRKFSLYSNLYLLNENYGKLNEYYSDGEYKLYEVDSKRLDYGAKIWTEIPVSSKCDITAGVDFKTGAVNASDIYFTSTDVIRNRGEMNTLAAYLQLKYYITPHFTAIGGVRYDIALFHDAAFSIEQPSYSIEYLAGYQFSDVETEHWSATNPKFTLQYTINEFDKIYVTVAKGFGAPILEDLCRTGRKKIGFKIANPALQPEHITNFETGFDFGLGKKLNFAASFYYTLGDNFIYFVTTGDSVNMGYTIAPIYQAKNISKVEIFGAEADINVALTNNLKAFGNYTYNHSQIKEYIANLEQGDKDLSGKFLTDVPMHKFSLGLSFQNKYVNISSSVKYTGERWLNDENKYDNVYLMSDKYPDYFLVDMKLWKQIRSLTLSVNIDNLLNTIYTDSKGFKSPGIFWMIQVKYNFVTPKTK
ncbi:MAG TPA: TonB-dependent receptor [Prolixibacteraceae bacterium]|nr:TonB-dependent receptor [Bacteroidales bacterium]HQN93447.1 TonB-dependent receptor [Prolixibacteraceae bacterium]